MSILRGLFERRVLTPNQIFGTDAQWWESGVSGTRVDQTTALTLAAVWSSVRLLSQDIATLPFHAIQLLGENRQEVNPQPSWIDEPIPGDPNQTGVDYLSQVCVSLLLDGNAFVLVLPDVFRPFELRVLNPRHVEVKQSGADVHYIVRGDNGVVVKDNVTALQMLHIPWVRRPGALRGMSPIEVQEQTIGRGLAAQEVSARFFGQGSMYGGILEYDKDSNVSDEDIKKTLAGLNKQHRGQRNAWALGALVGAKFNQTMGKAADSQQIETEKWIREQVLAAYGIPQFLGGSQEPGAVSYASTEQQGILYKQSAVSPITSRLQAAHSRLLPRGQEMKFNLNGLLRGDSKSRFEAYQSAVNTGWMLRSEARSLEDMAPVSGMDVPLAQQGMAPAGAIAEQTTKVKVDMATKLVQYGYEPAAALAFVGLPPITHSGVLPVTVQPEARDGELVERTYPVSEDSDVTPEDWVRLERMISDAVGRNGNGNGISVYLPSDVRLPPPEVQVTVPTPEITVNVPQQKMPDVIVNVAEREQPAPVVNVAAPDTVRMEITKMPRRVRAASRNTQGDLEGTVEQDG